MEINLLPFVVEAFGCTSKIYKDIDKLYQTRKYEFYQAAKNHELYSHQIVTEGSLLQEEYCKKALGILLVLEETQDEELMKAVFDIIQKGWTYAYLYVENHDKIDLDKFMMNVVKKAGGIDKVSDDWLNSQMLMVFFLALSSEKEIVSTESRAFFEKLLITRWNHYNEDDPYRISLKYATKEELTKVSNLKKQIFAKYGRISKYNAKHSTLTPKTESMAFIFDFERLSCESVFKTVDFKDRDIDEILLAYLYRNDVSDIDAAFDFLCYAIYVRYLIKAYKEVKKHYFKNNKETLYVELEGLEKELSGAKQEISRLSSLLSEANKNIKALERENARLQAELTEEKKNRQELNSLREFLFSLDSREEFLTEEKAYNLDELQSMKAIVIGGHERWQARMKQILPNFIFIHPDNIAYDLRFLDGIDAIFIYTNYLNHAIYYRTMEAIAGKDVIVGYINQSNEEMVLQEISRIVNKSKNKKASRN